MRLNDPTDPMTDPTSAGNPYVPQPGEGHGRTEAEWWKGPPPDGYTGPWPPPLPPGAHYGPIFGQVVGDNGGPIPNVDPKDFQPGGTYSRAPTPTPPPAGGAGGGAGPSTGTIGDLITPWTEKFTGPTSLDPFKYPAFTPTTAADMLADPSYKFRLDQGEQALEQSAAARGVLGSGGTLKDILDYGQNYGSQEFSNVDTRRRNDYTTNYGVAADVYGKDFALNQDTWNRSWQKYLEDYSIFKENQDRPYAKLFGQESLGLGASQ